MNSKDNQQAEKLSIHDVRYSPLGKNEWELADDAIAQAYPDIYNLGKGNWGHQRIANYGILRGAIAKAIVLYTRTITTEQVNEGVASGEAVCSICNNSGYYCTGYSGLECDGNAPMLERCDCEIGQPTPSQSNVLVEALQRDNTELKKFIEKAFLAHPNLDLDIEALATYSASTDSVRNKP